MGHMVHGEFSGTFTGNAQGVLRRLAIINPKP